VNPKRSFLGSQIFESKRGYYFGWGRTGGEDNASMSQTHCNIANNDHQVFFFVEQINACYEDVLKAYSARK
jgi:hypothetical protein